jgi:hypothetical protein
MEIFYEESTIVEGEVQLTHFAQKNSMKKILCRDESTISSPFGDPSFLPEDIS